MIYLSLFIIIIVFFLAFPVDLAITDIIKPPLAIARAA